MSFSLRTALVLPALLLACASQDDASTDDASTTSADVVESSACHEAWAKDAVCTEMSVPLDWETPSSGSITYLVRRFPAKTKPRAQMWLVAGGPGEAGAPFALVLPRLRAAMPDVTFFVPDHRGTGRSTRLGCGRGDDMAPACLEELVRQHGVAGLQAFSTTNAAKDLEHAIGANRTSIPSYVYGVSYGTYLVNRYLQLAPEQADGIVLDGVCPAEGCVDPDSNPPDVIGRRYLDICGKDELCSSKLGTAPAATLLGLYRKLDGGHCPPFTTELVKPLLAQLLDRPEKREAIAPLVYRLDRCTADDHRALLHFASTLAPSPDESVAGEGASDPLLSASRARSSSRPVWISPSSSAHVSPTRSSLTSRR